MTSATDELRRMLDERGVEYEVDEHGWVFFDVDGFGWIYVPSDTHGQLIHQRLLITPTQAIAATLGNEGVARSNDGVAELGAGTCHNNAPAYLDFLCSECGFVHYHSDTNDTGDGNEWRYCPNCGARCVG